MKDLPWGVFFQCSKDAMHDRPLRRAQVRLQIHFKFLVQKANAEIGICHRCSVQLDPRLFPFARDVHGIVVAFVWDLSHTKVSFQFQRERRRVDNICVWRSLMEKHSALGNCVLSFPVVTFLAKIYHWAKNDEQCTYCDRETPHLVV